MEHLNETVQSSHIAQFWVFCKSFSHFFKKKCWSISDINICEILMLPNKVVSFEQPGPDHYDVTVQFWVFIVKCIFCFRQVMGNI